jgi:hypothetical protein
VGMGHLTGAIRSAVMLDRGEVDGAIEVAHRYLRAVPVNDLVERADGLEVVAIATAAVQQLERTAEATAELDEIARQVPTNAMRATARRSAGVFAAARGDHAAACADLEEAVRLYSSSEATFDAARSRFELARSLLAVGHTGDAHHQMTAADEAFRALGCGRWARITSQWLIDAGSPGRQRARQPLTPRELEVLRLVARHSNDEIRPRWCCRCGPSSVTSPTSTTRSAHRGAQPGRWPRRTRTLEDSHRKVPPGYVSHPAKMGVGTDAHIARVPRQSHRVRVARWKPDPRHRRATRPTTHPHTPKENCRERRTQPDRRLASLRRRLHARQHRAHRGTVNPRPRRTPPRRALRDPRPCRPQGTLQGLQDGLPGPEMPHRRPARRR